MQGKREEKRTRNPKIVVYFFLILGFISHGLIYPSSIKELKLLDIYSINPLKPGLRMDLSGLTSDGKQLFVISDTSTQNEVYRLRLSPEKNEAFLEIQASFPEPWLKAYIQRTSSQGRFDLEAITWCQGRFYLADEGTRSVLSLDAHGVASEHDLGFAKFHAQKGKMNPFSGVRNAGLEAIACDPRQNRLYVFNERQFRMGYSYSLIEKKLLGQFDLPAGNALPRFEKGFWIYPDFAGAHFGTGLLYILVRNQRLILEVNPKTYRVIQRFNFAPHTRHLYQKNDPFGLAEGLVVQDGSFYIILDNNGHLRQGSKNDSRPVLLKLQ